MNWNSVRLLAFIKLQRTHIWKERQVSWKALPKESQGTGHSPSVPRHWGKGSQNSTNEKCKASEVAVYSSLHFWALVFKKKISQLQAFERATGIKKSGKHHLRELKKKKNGVFIPKKWRISSQPEEHWNNMQCKKLKLFLLSAKLGTGALS